MKENDRLNKFAELVSAKPSNFLEKFNNLKANKKSLDRSAEIAISVLDMLKEKKWSQKDLAEKMGVSAQYVSKIVKGKENFTFETIDRLEEVLGCQLISIVDNSMPLVSTPVLKKGTQVTKDFTKEIIVPKEKIKVKESSLMRIVYSTTREYENYEYEERLEM